VSQFIKRKIKSA